MESVKYNTTKTVVILILIIAIVGGVIFLAVPRLFKTDNEIKDSTNIPSNELISPTPIITPSTPSSSSSSSNKPTLTPTPSTNPTVQTYQVKVYFSKHPQSDDNPSVVYPVTRQSNTVGVATYAINQLIAGPNNSEVSQGYYSALKGIITGTSSCNGADFKITINKRANITEKNTATLQFCKDLAIPGELAGARIQSEIDSTLLQFSSIKKVVILSKKGDCFNDLSGLNRCLTP